MDQLYQSFYYYGQEMQSLNFEEQEENLN